MINKDDDEEVDDDESSGDKQAPAIVNIPIPINNSRVEINSSTLTMLPLHAIPGFSGKKHSH